MVDPLSACSKDDRRARRGWLIFTAITAVATVTGVIAAWRIAWVCDDAFISMRYAENLVQGHGLVFNVGERVEGYTNFLWTLWYAVGLRMGVDGEKWGIAWGLFFYACTILLLAVHSLRWRRECGGAALALPIAAVLAAIHHDWHVYATSGLETSLFTFLVLAGYVLLIDSASLPAGGALLSLAALTRPDGVVFVLMAGLYVSAFRRPFARSVALFAMPCVLFLVPFELWRWFYYHDWLPNTYYAKSAMIPWYSQGWTYVKVYYASYWILLLGLVLLAVGWRWGGRISSNLWPARVLSLGFVVAYTFCVMRVGGDFMHARLLIPTTPYSMLLIEYGLVALTGRRTIVQAVAVVAVCAALLLGPRSIPTTGVSGIKDEWTCYPRELTDDTKATGMALRQWFDGLHVGIAFLGSEARMVYYAKPDVAVESETGLTDRFVAHQKLVRRGRVGHEKAAPAPYLIGSRRLNFVFHRYGALQLQLDRYIPLVPIRLGDTDGLVLRWDPKLMSSLRARGAQFEDYRETLDGWISLLGRMNDDAVREQYRMAKLFYFDHVRDPKREDAFRRRLCYRPTSAGMNPR